MRYVCEVIVIIVVKALNMCQHGTLLDMLSLGRVQASSGWVSHWLGQR